MDRRELLIAAASAALGSAAPAFGSPEKPARGPLSEPPPPGASAAEEHARWLALAESLKPTLTETEQQAVALVRPVPDASLPLRFRMETEAPADGLPERLLGKGDSFILDFAGHRTGHLSFDLVGEGRGVDAPARLRLTFGEVPTDVAEPLYPYKGQLSSSWLPDEVVNVDFLPQHVRLPRRYAFRYVKVEVIDTSSTFKVRFRNVRAHAVTSATSTPAPLASPSEIARRIDSVAVATLRDCMQTTFEDGPRRDQRLWVGDLRLQALANYATFRRNDLVKRCLYLFAGLPREDGLVCACVYEKPRPAYGGIHIFDYAALYNVALLDYVRATGDLSTGRELWPVALRQLEILGRTVGADGLFVDPRNIWLFVDWNQKLQRDAAIQGVLLYAYRQTLELARAIGRQADVADYPDRIARMTETARRAFWDPVRRVFVSGPERQVSWASQAWLAIAGAAPDADAAGAIRTALATKDAVRPNTPYLYHYVVEGMLACGMRREALDLVLSYWGGMIAAGADTFWEVYDPANPLSSPYGDIHINSYCHAWSCTPSYLFRSRGLGEAG
jgi:hypothetical protein